MKMTRKIFSALLIATLVGSLGFSFFAISDTFSRLGTSVASHTGDATLASTSTHRPATTFAVTYWQQATDQCINQYDAYATTTRQFEWSKCGYHYDSVVEGLVNPTLDQNFLPTPSYASATDAKLAGALTANRNVYGSNFVRWFNPVAGLSTEQNSTIKLNYSATDDAYSYESADFHPVGDSLFTMKLAIPFHATDNSSLEITADDDTWVFLDNTLALDLGSIHHPVTASLDLTQDGTIYIFHADRDSAESVFNLKLSHCILSTPDTTLAYDDSSYIAPLGESTTTAPNHDEAILNTITLEFTILGFLILFTPFAVRLIMRH